MKRETLTEDQLLNVLVAFAAVRLIPSAMRANDAFERDKFSAVPTRVHISSFTACLWCPVNLLAQEPLFLLSFVSSRLPQKPPLTPR